MNLDYVKCLKKKKEIVSVVLLGISAFLAVLILIKVVGFFVVSARAEGLVKRAITQNNTSAKDMEKFFAESREVANELKRKNLFAPPPPKQQPIKQVWGILGDEVLINDRWYKVGDMVQDAKIVAIAPTQVRIEWDGREIGLAPIDAVIPPSPVGPRSKEPVVVAKGKESKEERAEMVTVGAERGPVFGPEGRGGFGMLRPEEAEKLRDRWESMSEAERDRFRAEMEQRRERFMNMSPEERQRFAEEMRQRFGGGPGFGRGGGPDRGPGGESGRGSGGGPDRGRGGESGRGSGEGRGPSDRR